MKLKDSRYFNLSEITEAIEVEREAQFRKWGIQTHTLSEWCLIAGEEFGEFLKEACDLEFGKIKNPAFALHELTQAITVLCNIHQMLREKLKEVK